jgi:hypothetical protein
LGDESQIFNRTKTFKSATELEVTLEAADVADPGALHFTVFNPAPGGGVSGPFKIDVTDALEPGEGDVAGPAAPPALAASDPPTLEVGTSALTITLVGERLTGAAATVTTVTEPDTPKDRSVEAIDDGSVSLTLDPSDVAEPGTLTIQITTQAGTAPLEVEVVPTPGE